MIGVPPVAVICWRYSLPIVAAASVVVVMAGAAGSVPPPGVLSLHNAGHADGLVGVDVADGVNAVVARERRAVGLYGKAIAAGVAVAGRHGEGETAAGVYRLLEPPVAAMV